MPTESAMSQDENKRHGRTIFGELFNLTRQGGHGPAHVAVRSEDHACACSHALLFSCQAILFAEFLELLILESAADFDNSETTDRLAQIRVSVEFTKECDFQLPVRMVVCVVALQEFIQTLKQESPKAVDRAKIANDTEDVCNVVKVRFYKGRVVLCMHVNSEKSSEAGEKNLQKTSKIIFEQFLSSRQRLGIYRPCKDDLTARRKFEEQVWIVLEHSYGLRLFGWPFAISSGVRAF